MTSVFVFSLTFHLSRNGTARTEQCAGNVATWAQDQTRNNRKQFRATRAFTELVHAGRIQSLAVNGAPLDGQRVEFLGLFRNLARQGDNILATPYKR